VHCSSWNGSAIPGSNLPDRRGKTRTLLGTGPMWRRAGLAMQAARSAASGHAARRFTARVAGPRVEHRPPGEPATRSRAAQLAESRSGPSGPGQPGGRGAPAATRWGVAVTVAAGEAGPDGGWVPA
jgi:hypothetical protein